MKRKYSVLFLLLLSTSYAFAIPVEVSESPSSNQAQTIQTILGAKVSLEANIYQLSSLEIAGAFLDRINAGVKVRILQEGQPIRRTGTAFSRSLSSFERGVQKRLIRAMTRAGEENRYFEMNSSAGGKRRYNFNHAKYIIADGESVLVSSENFTDTGNPTPGNRGNRGWQTVIHDSQVANEYLALFEEDVDAASGDIIDWTDNSSSGVIQNDASLFGLGANQTWTTSLFSFNIEPIWAVAEEFLAPASHRADASQAVTLTSPDTSLPGLIHLIDQAKRTIDIQQMTFTSYWGRRNIPSPLVEAVVEAARRGVQVRVLLNDERVFGDELKESDNPTSEPPKNKDTAEDFNQIAETENLRLKAKVANIEQMGVTYIHNKGVLVDGNKTLVSSVNWNKNSTLSNRETAVVIVSPEIHQYFKALFDQDWNAGAGSEN